MAQLNRLPEAEEHFRKATELDPGFRDALLELASLLERAEQIDKAMAIYDQFPNDAAAEERVIALLDKAKRNADVEPRIVKLLERDPKNFDLRMLYGRVLRDERKFAGLPHPLLRHHVGPAEGPADVLGGEIETMRRSLT